MPTGQEHFAGRSKRTMTHSVVVSILLHASLALPLLFFIPKQSQPVQNDKLLVELFGMVAERQTEQSAPAAAAKPAPPQKTAQPQQKKVAPKPELKQIKTSTVDSPVQVPTQEEQARPETAAAGSASELQKQQTLQVQDKNIEELKKYLAALKKKVQTHLLYPDEAKRSGYEGTPIIKFTITENGAIRPGSLVVARTSGYPVLDDYALKATLASAPFDRPTKEMEVAIGLNFGITR